MEVCDIRKRILLGLLIVAVIAGAIAVAVANSGLVYTWEETFEVKKPEIKCRIEVGERRVLGAPVKVWVCLRLGDCYWTEWKDEYDDRYKDECADVYKCPCDDGCDDDWRDHWKDGPYVNGTYSVELYWWNSTMEDWQYVMHLQEETNLTLTCFGHVETYTFVPMWEGEYKVVVTFAVDSEVYSFTNED